jgi:hypothetical protein
MEIARTNSIEGLFKVIYIANNDPDAMVRLTAWKVVFERAWGKPKQEVSLDAAVEHRFVIALPATDKPLSADAWQRLYGRQELIEGAIADGGEEPAGGD